MTALNELMEFGRVVRSDGEGGIEKSDDAYSESRVMVDVNHDGQVTDPEVFEGIEGWEPMTGFSGQHGYSGPIMHSSEFVGGGLETHILENAGLYVTVVVECQYPDAVWWITPPGQGAILDTICCESADAAIAKYIEGNGGDAEDFEASEADDLEPAGWMLLFRED